MVSLSILPLFAKDSAALRSSFCIFPSVSHQTAWSCCCSLGMRWKNRNMSIHIYFHPATCLFMYVWTYFIYCLCIFNKQGYIILGWGFLSSGIWRHVAGWLTFRKSDSVSIFKGINDWEGSMYLQNILQHLPSDVAPYSRRTTPSVTSP